MVEEKTIFSCRQCGQCCHGETTVSLDEDDLNRMAAFFGRPLAEIKERYLRVSGNVVQMKTVNGHCIFYNKGCTIHPAKPWRCGQWPLHPSIMSDKSNFEAIKNSCPGIKGEQGYESFCKNLSAFLKKTGGSEQG